MTQEEYLRLLSSLLSPPTQPRPTLNRSLGLPPPPHIPVPEIAKLVRPPLAPLRVLGAAPPVVSTQPRSPLNLATSCQRIKALAQRTAQGNISSLGRELPDADKLALGDGRQLRAAILYADMRGFSRLVVNNGKRATLVILDTFVSEMTRLVSAFHGEVVDCAGDRILAAFWRPASDSSVQPIHDAVTCGLWMQTVMLKAVVPELLARGCKGISCGIGIDYGIVVVARVGIRNRNKLVFLGRPAVYAAKLEEIAAAGSIVVSKLVYDYRPPYLNEQNGWIFDGGPPDNAVQWYACNQIFAGEEPPR